MPGDFGAQVVFLGHAGGVAGAKIVEVWSVPGCLEAVMLVERWLGL